MSFERAAPIVRENAQALLSRGQSGFLLLTTSGVALCPVLAYIGLLPRAVFGLTAILTWLIAAITVIYVGVIAYKSIVVFKAVGEEAAGLPSTVVQLAAVDEDQLPSYTVLVPLYREAAILDLLITNLNKINYPKSRLQVLVLVEDDDDETISALSVISLPDHFEVVVVPESFPRTKPKACNFGLQHATGAFCVIYDAEDRPDPDQLLRAVAAFAVAPRTVVCMQAELQYFNPSTNALTRWFAAEYACNFSLILPGLTAMGAPVPLGGTSNHFRTDVLRELGGWDGYNVTEDADLGMWIARSGFRVAIIDSVTWEEANSRVGNWIRQRSRWIKGYIQTYLVHMRHPVLLFRQLGFRNFLSFQFVVGGTPLTLLANPIFWGLTVAYVGFSQEWVSTVFPAPVLYLGVTSMVLGNLVTVWFQMAACMKRGLYPSVKWVLAVPVYWALMSVAAFKAFGQLLNPRLRHHWEKTTHGLVVDDGAVQHEQAMDRHSAPRHRQPVAASDRWMPAPDLVAVGLLSAAIDTPAAQRGPGTRPAHRRPAESEVLAFGNWSGWYDRVGLRRRGPQPDVVGESG